MDRWESYLLHRFVAFRNLLRNLRRNLENEHCVLHIKYLNLAQTISI